MQMRTLLMMSGLLVLSGTVGTAQTAQPGQAAKPSENFTVRGCLTKGPTNSFVLTPTDAGDPLSSSVASKTHDVTPTYTYQLSGGQNLDAHVGQIVTATGTVDRGQKGTAKVDREREQAAGATAATPKGKTPTVKTEEKAKIEVRHLAVQSVTPTGKSCSATGSGTSS